MEHTKIYLEVPNDIHLAIKRLQLDKQDNGERKSLKEMYYEVLRKALEKEQQPVKQ